MLDLARRWNWWRNYLCSQQICIFVLNESNMFVTNDPYSVDERWQKLLKNVHEMYRYLRKKETNKYLLLKLMRCVLLQSKFIGNYSVLYRWKLKKIINLEHVCSCIYRWMEISRIWWSGMKKLLTADISRSAVVEILFNIIEKQ